MDGARSGRGLGRETAWGGLGRSLARRALPWAVAPWADRLWAWPASALGLLVLRGARHAPALLQRGLTPRAAVGSQACLSLQESHQTAADFRLYVENHTRHLDEVSRRHVRVYQLYSRSSSGHLQVLGKRVRANGEDGNKYALLAVESDTFGSHVRIKGKETGYYVCMDRRGKVLGKLDGRSQGCVFVEEVLENNFTAFMLAGHRDWFLGFTRKGRAQRGPRTHRTQREGHFMKRPPQGTGGEGQSPFRFTALTPRTKPALGP
uniref:Uncharacterized protein n=1 Tax=Chrysemys picta bellii TaxID=8478 RepID=A0A8C3IIY0_CHRPI|nr:fibroblast growth factor 18-like isoform X1 [Chrysemys picta bellii]